MKALILAGGKGTRLREETEFLPKPLVEVGGMPAIWHVMSTLAAGGITDFVILGGYKVAKLKHFFANFATNYQDFTVDLSGASRPRFLGTLREASWTVTVLDTGLETETAGRLTFAKEILAEEDFVLTYGDGFSDINISAVVEANKASDRIVTISTTAPLGRFGVVTTDREGRVTSFSEKPASEDRINIGFMALKHEIFEHIRGNESLEGVVLPRIANLGLLGARHHEGFFHPMDTLRDQSYLDDLVANNSAPWMIW